MGFILRLRLGYIMSDIYDEDTNKNDYHNEQRLIVYGDSFIFNERGGSQH